MVDIGNVSYKSFPVYIQSPNFQIPKCKLQKNVAMGFKIV